MNPESKEPSGEKPEAAKPQDEGKKDKEKKEVNVVLEVSKDKLEAHITLIPLVESPAYSADELRKTLEAKGIKFGLKEALLAQLKEKVPYDQRLLIATGVPPAPGKEGRLEFEFKTDVPVKVKVGDKIGRLVPSEPGVEGTDVHGEKVPLAEAQGTPLPKLTNVELSHENGDILVAKLDGYLLRDDLAIQVQPFFAMESMDDYEAEVKVAKRCQEDDFGLEDLKKFLAEKGIVYGILEEELNKIFARGKYDQPVLVARGKQVVNDRDGEIKLFFETVVRPKVDAHGNLDYKELNLIQNVKKGDKLAETTAPVKGSEGITITGNKVAPKEGVRPALPAGDNTGPDPKDPNVLLAEIDGSVKMKGNLVLVDPIFAVKGEVGYETGNIDFNGSVIINGDVKSGFKIKASRDVQVEGVVEDAIIEAGSDVLIKMGFIGKGEGKITAGGKVTARYCVNQNVVAVGDVVISDYVMHSSIQTSGLLQVKDSKGLIVGGEACAVQGIEVKLAGNQNYTPTVLMAGLDKQTGEQLRLKRAYLMKNAENIREIGQILGKFARLKLVRKTLPPEKEAILQKLEGVKKEQEEKQRQTFAEIKELEAEMSKSKNALIKVLEQIFPGVSITICNRHLVVKEPLQSVYYRFTEQELIAADLEELDKPAQEAAPDPAKGSAPPSGKTEK